MRIIIPTAIITPILLLTGIHVANALTNATCTSTNGTCTVDNFSQHPDGSLELYAWTITSQTDSTRIQLFDPDSDLVGVFSVGEPPGGTGANCGAWHGCGVYGVPISCNASGASVVCESVGGGNAGQILCKFNNGGGNESTTILKCCDYNGGC